jgi:hypothetical protein
MSTRADTVHPPITVFKFGGTSVGTPQRFRTVIDLATETAAEGRVVAVVSALSNVTRRELWKLSPPGRPIAKPSSRIWLQTFGRGTASRREPS